MAAIRTAIGNFQDALSGIATFELGTTVITRLLAQSGLSPDAIDGVILGQVLTAGSSLKSLQLAIQAIQCGDTGVVEPARIVDALQKLHELTTYADHRDPKTNLVYLHLSGPI